MEEFVNALQLVVESLQGVKIEATEENLDRMLGSIQTIKNIKEALKNIVVFQGNGEMTSAPEQAEKVPEVDVEVEEIQAVE